MYTYSQLIEILRYFIQTQYLRAIKFQRMFQKIKIAVETIRNYNYTHFKE